MHELLFEMDWITAVRSDGLPLFFKAITHLGGTVFGFAFLGLGLWLGPQRVFGRIILISLISKILNAHLKAFFMLSRPDEIYHLVSITESSFPSGHAQHGATMWLGLAHEIGRPWAWLVDSIVVVGVAASRVCLGVHFGRDVVAGMMIGILMVLYFRWLTTTPDNSLSRKQAFLQVALLALVQFSWIGLTMDTTRGRFLPTAVFLGFWAGLFLWQKASFLSQMDRRWSVGWTVLVVVFAVPPLWTAGATWFGPMGLGTHPIAATFQFAVLGCWMAVAAPSTLGTLKMR